MKVKTDGANQIQVSHWSYKKDSEYFSQQRDFF